MYQNQAQLRRFVQNAKDGHGLGKKMYFGMVDEKLAAAIKEGTGLNLEGHNVTLRADNVRKIFKSHGNSATEAPRGQRPVEISDFLKIPQVIGEPDGINLSDQDYYGKPAIEFVKTIDGSKITVITVDSGGSLDLFVQTMYAGIKKEA